MKISRVILIIALFFVTGIIARPAEGQAKIQVISDEVVVNYPRSIEFELSAESKGDSPITEVRLYWQSGPSEPFDVVTPRFTSGSQITVDFAVNAQFLRLPPFSQLSYRWELRDDAGNVLETERTFFEYEDTRLDWQEISSESIRLLWYDFDVPFAESLLTLADEAYARLSTDFGVVLDEKPIVVIYAEQDSFVEFQAMLLNSENVVGRYFPGYNITVNLVTPDMPYNLYADTIAHELSHLYSDNFYKGYSELPLWLEEGLATYNEGGALAQEVFEVRYAASTGDLIPFVDLPRAIRDNDIAVATLAYSEGATVFEYIVETWGQDALASFLASFKETTNVDRVTQNIFGLTIADFEIGWRAWLGYPVESVPRPVPTITLVPLTIPTPTYGVPGS